MSKNKILICDDEQERQENWKQRLESIFEVDELFSVEFEEPAKFMEAASALERRRATAREKNQELEGFPSDNASIFDETDILIIDFDLLRLESSYYLTGENVAYLARCYSKCGLIVALNEFEHGEDVFDLKMKGHPESNADLNISDAQLDNTGLWKDSWAEFRPWSWPLLPKALDKFNKRVENLRDNIDIPIFDYLGISEEDAKTFPRSTIEFITKSSDVSETTFRNFVEKSSNGLRHKDKPFSKDSLVRIAAARVAQWLEYLVLTGQDILVDAPHLISRYSSLIKGQSKDIETWNRTASFKEHNDLGLSNEIIEDFRFKQQDWLSRPAWYWNKVSTCEDVPEVKDPWMRDRPDYVFCEDISRFLPRKEAREFVAELESPFVRRFVKRVEGINYRPQVRFSL